MDNRSVPTKVRHILLVTKAGAYPTVKIVLFVLFQFFIIVIN